MTQPIEVNSNLLPDQLWAAGRQMAPAVVTFLIGRHLIANDTAAMLGIVAGVIYPIVASQLKTRQRSQLMVTLANAAPDEVAVVK